MIRNKYLAFALCVILVIVFWCLLRYLFDKETFELTVSNLMIPLVTGMVVGYFVFLLTPVFLPGKSHGQRSLVDYSP